MEGLLEGVGVSRRRLPRVRMLLLIVAVTAYLIFRMVQGLMWLAGHR